MKTFAPKFMMPVVERTEFAGKIPVEMTKEGTELIDRVRTQLEVRVIR